MKKLIFLIFLCSASIIPQESDISRLLSDIEKGHPENAIKTLTELKKKEPEDPSVIYLDAVLTTDGKDAVDKYKRVYEKYPSSEYADASMFFVYSYLYSAGNYISAGKILKEFRDSYPNSAYLKLAEEMEAPSEEKETLNKVSPENSINKNTSDKFTIQAGAFLSLTNARRLQKKFEGAGYFSEIKEKIIGGSTFNIVYAGRFQEENEARNFLLELKDKFKIEGRVVTIQ